MPGGIKKRSLTWRLHGMRSPHRVSCPRSNLTHPVNRFDTVITGGLATVGVVAVLLGIGTIIYATQEIKPHLDALADQALESVELAERGLEVLSAYSDAIGPLNPPQSNTLEAIQILPNALEQSANVSVQAAESLVRSAITLRELEDDLGIVLPGHALRENAEALETSARSLRGLSPMLYRLHAQMDTVATDLTRASKRTERLQEALQNEDVTIERAQARLTQTRMALQSSQLPTEITRLIGMVGGLFIGMGLLLLGMAGIWRRLALMSTRDTDSP